VRYDGIYRIAACWRKPGNQGPLVCRYLFVRADNEPAPWSTEGAPAAPTLCCGPAAGPAAGLPACCCVPLCVGCRGQLAFASTAPACT
jgi:hypothetical protein